MIIGLCQMFPGLDPGAAYQADARLLRLVHVYRLAHPDPEGGEQEQ